VPGCTNRLSFCPRARNGTAAAWESLYVKWSESDLLPIQSWVARENLLWFGTLAQHIGNKFDWNARPTIHRRTTHNLAGGGRGRIGHECISLRGTIFEGRVPRLWFRGTSRRSIKRTDEPLACCQSTSRRRNSNAVGSAQRGKSARERASFLRVGGARYTPVKQKNQRGTCRRRAHVFALACLKPRKR
jgi:hypothetical protein